MNKQEFRPERRQFLTRMTAAAAGVMLAGNARPETSSKSAGRVLRLIHMTDAHVQPERRAAEGFAAALRHAAQLTDEPDLLLLGGDIVMDSFAQDEARTALQWKLVHEALARHWKKPVRACIGNHDIWGWDKPASKTTGDEPHWGKARALKELDIPHRYYHFELAGWHFLMLDGTFAPPERPNAYVSRLDDDQFAWLEAELAKIGKTQPVLVLSHEPILSVTSFEFMSVDGYRTVLPDNAVLSDCRRVFHLFKSYPNVRLCLSGHEHLVDRVDYAGTTYICGGAVSGAWWGGKHYQCAEGFGVVDLYADGRFGYEYVTYGWQAKG